MKRDMTVASQLCTLWSPNGDSIAFITYADDADGQFGGIECENIWLTDETKGMDSNSIVHDLDNYDDMEYSAKSTRQNPRSKRWKRFFQAIRPSRKGRVTKPASSKHEKGKSEDECCNSRGTASTTSLHSRSSLEGLVITTPNPEGVEAERDLDLKVIDFLSRFIRHAKKNPALSKPTIVIVTNSHRDDSTLCTEETETSSVSESSEATSINESPLIAQRLLETGLVNHDEFMFVPDYVSKEVLHLVEEKKEADEYNPTNDKNVSHVKTGIWEVTCFQDDGQSQEPYYIVTGVSMDDRVDTKKLRKYVFAGEQHKRRPKLVMAPTEIAEQLAGFQSGTMAPICHTQSMKLYLEESLVKNVDPQIHHLNVGSGMFGKCLSISAHHFLEVAKANPKGFELCPIIRKSK